MTTLRTNLTDSEWRDVAVVSILIENGRYLISIATDPSERGITWIKALDGDLQLPATSITRDVLLRLGISPSVANGRKFLGAMAEEYRGWHDERTP